MAWHSKRHNIKHRKAAQDAKKAKIYSRLAKQIQLEAMKWADINLNPSLSLAVYKAKSAWVPKPVIEKAIAKGSWQDTSESLQEVFYEWYWPAWTAMYIKCITSNTNRSAANIRAILAKYWWNMWQEGSVSWQFSPKWVVYVLWKFEIVNEKWKEIEKIYPFDEEFEDFLIESDVENFEIDEEIARIIVPKQDLWNLLKNLEDASYKIEEQNIEFIPNSTVNLTEEEYEKLEKIIWILEEDEDVDEVFHNAA